MEPHTITDHGYRSSVHGAPVHPSELSGTPQTLAFELVVDERQNGLFHLLPVAHSINFFQIKSKILICLTTTHVSLLREFNVYNMFMDGQVK